MTSAFAVAIALLQSHNKVTDLAQNQLRLTGEIVRHKGNPALGAIVEPSAGAGGPSWWVVTARRVPRRRSIQQGMQRREPPAKTHLDKGLTRCIVLTSGNGVSEDRVTHHQQLLIKFKVLKVIRQGTRRPEGPAGTVCQGSPKRAVAKGDIVDEHRGAIDQHGLALPVDVDTQSR